MNELGIIVALFLPRLLGAGVILAGFALGSLLMQAVTERVIRRQGLGADLGTLLGVSLRTLVLVIGVITALGTVGIDVSALVAGLGLTGFALGFALRDAISNFLAGLMVLFYRPFHRGDRITISGQEGQVREIDLRYTTLESEDKTILVPNSQILTNIVIVNKPDQPATTTGPQLRAD